MTAEQPEAGGVKQSQPGATLRKAREARKMSLADVAAALHLSTTALQNLESGAFDRLPGHTFARGYIRAYAKLLDMDQELLVRQFDQVTGSDAIGSSVASLGRIDEPVRVSHGVLRMLSLAVLALLVLVIFFWWQDRAVVSDDLALSGGIQQVEVESADGSTQIHPLEPEDQAVELAQQETAAPAPGLPAVATGTEPAITAQTEAAPTGISDETTIAPAITEQLTPAEPVAAVASVDAAEPEAVQAGVVVGSGEGLLSIRFTANCWTQIADANGKVLVSALKRPGEDIQLAVKLPLELRLGFASGAKVAFNGKPIDMQAFTTGETARLKLGQ